MRWHSGSVWHVLRLSPLPFRRRARTARRRMTAAGMNGRGGIASDSAFRRAAAAHALDVLRVEIDVDVIQARTAASESVLFTCGKRINNVLNRTNITALGRCSHASNVGHRCQYTLARSTIASRAGVNRIGATQSIKHSISHAVCSAKNARGGLACSMESRAWCLGVHGGPSRCKMTSGSRRGAQTR